jgi:carboxymethylenebutenolidase
MQCAQAFLKAEGSPKVGITGFCMGGALTMGALAASPDISCGAPFYGVNFGLFEAAQLANKPVQAHFGAEVCIHARGLAGAVAALRLGCPCPE